MVFVNNVSSEEPCKISNKEEGKKVIYFIGLSQQLNLRPSAGNPLPEYVTACVNNTIQSLVKSELNADSDCLH